ncbi:MAG: ATP-binding cassette domain-containing protein [Tissierellia bacterium]|nr:ATP-binding cassette domain-containing protein [Tissierellia bacterium]
MFHIQNLQYKSILRIDHLRIPSEMPAIITGESGAGKTTLLYMLAQLLTPDSGTITYNGISLQEIPPIEHRRKVVMVPQKPVLFPGDLEMNLQIGCEFAQKEKPSSKQLIQLLEDLRLKKNLTEDPSSYSGGEIARIALARALLMKPDVLLLDEPTAALDQGNEKHILEFLFSYGEKHGIKFIIVSHSFKDSPHVATYRIHMKKFTNPEVNYGL